MALRLEAVTFDVADAPAVAAFWAGLLDREVLTESGGALVSGDNTQVGLRFVTSDTEQGRADLLVATTPECKLGVPSSGMPSAGNALGESANHTLASASL
jgi:hypothetical protein